MGRADELADEMSEESFPSSDPPSTWAGPDRSPPQAGGDLSEGSPDETAADEDRDDDSGESAG